MDPALRRSLIAGGVGDWRVGGSYFEVYVRRNGRLDVREIDARLFVDRREDPRPQESGLRKAARAVSWGLVSVGGAVMALAGAAFLMHPGGLHGPLAGVLAGGAIAAVGGIGALATRAPSTDAPDDETFDDEASYEDVSCEDEPYHHNHDAQMAYHQDL